MGNPITQITRTYPDIPGHTRTFPRDFFGTCFSYLLPGPIFVAKVANMSQNGTKKLPKSDPKYRFLLTSGTSFRYSIYQSGATLAHPGEVPKAVKKLAFKKHQQIRQNVGKCVKKCFHWEAKGRPTNQHFPRIFCPGGPWVPKWLQGLPQESQGPPKNLFYVILLQILTHFW